MNNLIIKKVIIILSTVILAGYFSFTIYHFSHCPFVWKNFDRGSNKNPEERLQTRLNFMSKRLTNQLNLTDMQSQKMESLKKEIFQKYRRPDTENPLRNFNNLLGEELKKDQFDVDRLEEMSDSIFLWQKSNTKFLLLKAAEFHKILTPPQRQSLGDKVKHFHNKKRPLHNKRSDKSVRAEDAE